MFATVGVLIIIT